MNYLNDNDPFACAWVRELIAAGEIPEAYVDERSVTEVEAKDLVGYRQCHFFGGIAGWCRALQLAGFDPARSIWTASCPCQPFSTAGKGEGEKDARHLWPVLLGLIRQCRPAICFGEQVSSRAGYEWLARVRDDLEAEGYAVGCADMPAACVSAPHIRQRLFWGACTVGVADGARCKQRRRCVADGAEQLAAERTGEARDPSDARRAVLRGERQPLAGAAGRGEGEGNQRQRVRGDAGDGVATGDPSDASGVGWDRRPGEQGSGRQAAERGEAVGNAGDGVQPGDASDAHDGLGRRRSTVKPGKGADPSALGQIQSGRRDVLGDRAGFWDAYDILDYRDGKRRRVESGSFPLVAGLPRGVVPGGDPSLEEVQATAEARQGRLRGYGNAIVPQVAAAFIRAFLEAEAEVRGA